MRRTTSMKVEEKNENKLTQVTMESKKAEPEVGVVGVKRKKMNAQTFKATFEMQRILDIVPDGENELARSEKFVDVCSDKSKLFGSQTMKDTGDGCHDCSKRVVGEFRDESIKRASEEAPKVSTVRDDQAVLKNDINVDEPCSKYSHTKLSVGEPADSGKNKGTSESSRDGPITANRSERCILSFDEEGAPPASLVCKSCNLEGTCLLCSKSKRRLSNVNGREFIEKSADEEHVERQILTDPKVALKDKAGASEIHDDAIKKIQKKCDKRMEKLVRKQRNKIHELLKIWEDKEAALQRDHKLMSTFIRSIHGETSEGMGLLKVLDDGFEKKIADHNIQKDAELKNLEAEYLTVTVEEREKAANWLAQAKACYGELILPSQSDEDTFIDIGGGVDKLPMSGQSSENVNPNKCFFRQEKGATPFISSIHAPDDATCRETPVEDFVTVNSENEGGVESCASVELLNQSKSPIDDSEVVQEKLSAPLEQVSGERQPIDPSKEQAVVSPDSCDLLPQKDLDTLVEENLSAPQTVIETFEPTHSVVPAPSNFESPITDNIANPELFGQLHSLSADVSLSYNGSAAIEDHPRGRCSPQTAAATEETEVVLHESISHMEENSEMNPDCGVANEQNVELPSVVQNDMAIPQKVVNTPETPNHTVPQVVEIDANNHGFVVNPTHQLSSCNSALSFPDPLQNELERMCKEMELLEKSHEDMVAQMEYDRGKELEEMVSQIRNRYEVQLHETEAQFRLKRDERGKNMDKLRLNTILADSWETGTCGNLRAAGGIRSIAPQHDAEVEGGIAALPNSHVSSLLHSPFVFANALRYQTSAVVEPDVVCLSDDE